jgi:shikimate kinase
MEMTMCTGTLTEPTLDMPTKLKPGPTQIPRKPEVLDRIVLTGFMGSGKTTVGALLADRLGWNFIDLDREIEARHQQTVPQIFAEHGESHFRHLESATLASLLGQRRVVLALGGGAPEELGNRLLLEQTPHTAVVYLSAPFDTLIARCAAQATDPAATARPNLADLNLAERRFRLRRSHYERIAAHTVNTGNLTLTQTVDAILAAIRKVKAPR